MIIMSHLHLRAMQVSNLLIIGDCHTFQARNDGM